MNKQIRKIALILSVFIGSVAFVGVSSHDAMAADRIMNIVSKVESQESLDNRDKIHYGASHYRLFMEYTINSPVKNGDYFEIETHSLPRLNVKDIYSSDGGTKIGEVVSEVVYGGSRVDVSDDAKFDNLRPEGNSRVRYRVVFNENAEKMNDISFSFSGLNLYNEHTKANKDYISEHWVSVNGDKVFSKNVTIAGNGSQMINNFLGWSETILNVNDNTIRSNFGFMAPRNMTGLKMGIEIDNDSMYDFSSVQPIVNRTYPLISDEIGRVNQYGVIRGAPIRYFGENRTVLGDKNMIIAFHRYDGEQATVGLGDFRLKFTKEGEEYFLKNGKMPPLKFDVVLKDGETVVYRQLIQSPSRLMGDIANYKSTLKDEDQPNIQPAIPVEKEKTTDEVKVPHTGFRRNDSVGGLIFVSVLILASCLLRRCRSKVVF